MSTGCASSGDLAKLQDEQTALKTKVDSLTATNKQCDKKLDNFFKKNKILSVDLIKIDTEGYEYSILKGLTKNFHKVKFIVFEHHYDNMIIKNYTFLNINELLKKNNLIYSKSIFVFL